MDDVVAHLISSARTTRLGFAAGMVRARFDFDRDHAADVDVTIGSGPQVRGTALGLLLAISGRDVAYDELEGPGVDELVLRLPA